MPEELLSEFSPFSFGPWLNHEHIFGIGSPHTIVAQIPPTVHTFPTLVDSVPTAIANAYSPQIPRIQYIGTCPARVEPMPPFPGLVYGKTSLPVR